MTVCVFRYLYKNDSEGIIPDEPGTVGPLKQMEGKG